MMGRCGVDDYTKLHNNHVTSSSNVVGGSVCVRGSGWEEEEEEGEREGERGGSVPAGGGGREG